MLRFPVSIVWRISAWSCSIRIRAMSGSTRPHWSIAISAFLAAMSASAAVTSAVIIVLVIVTDPAVAPTSPAAFVNHPDRDVAMSPTLWIAATWFSKPSGSSDW
jgi:hypothetical protein